MDESALKLTVYNGPSLEEAKAFFVFCVRWHIAPDPLLMEFKVQDEKVTKYLKIKKCTLTSEKIKDAEYDEEIIKYTVIMEGENI